MELKIGTYFAQGSVFARSYRAIAQKGNRTCIHLVDGPPSPYAGYARITVSHVSMKDGQPFIEATRETIHINSNPDMSSGFHFTLGEGEGRTAVWEHRQNTFKPSATIDECLSAIGIYVKIVQGPFIPGITTLTAQNPGSKINVRSGPGTNFVNPHFGIAGDEVSCQEVAEGQDGKSLCKNLYLLREV
jgi:hypothetical protein